MKSQTEDDDAVSQEAEHHINGSVSCPQTTGAYLRCEALSDAAARMGVVRANFHQAFTRRFTVPLTGYRYA